MDPFVHEWLNLFLRWAHFTVGIAWIGSSFYFNWLEGRLDRTRGGDGVAGELWSVHGGGFYHLKKYEVAPPRLPELLHWFKWEAYTTWITGFALLIVVFYLRPTTLLGNNPQGLSDVAAVLVSLGFLVGGWLVYHGLAGLLLPGRVRLFLVIALPLVVGLAWLTTAVFDPRAGFLHFGAVIGTIMVANVFFVIIPAQKKMVAAMMAGDAPDPAPGKAALNRSLHNNYLTLPVLFVMVSAHFPSTFSATWNWVVLLLLGVGSALIRHFFNLRNRAQLQPAWLGVGAALMAAAFWLARPEPRPQTAEAAAPPLWEVLRIVDQRCAGCHAVQPSQPGFAVAPRGLVLETPRQIHAAAASIAQQAVVTQFMPPGNLTGMTETERATLGVWIGAGAPVE